MPKLLNFPDLKVVKGIRYSRRHLARLEQAGKFPRRVSLGLNAVAWVESEIDAHIEAAMKARIPPAPRGRKPRFGL